MPRRNRNRAEVPGAQNALEALKEEVAGELGVPDYENVDKGALPSRLNGKVGGVMVRKMIEYAEEAMKASPQGLQAVEAQPGANQEDIQTAQQSLQAANAFMNQFEAGQQAQNGLQNQFGVQQPTNATLNQFSREQLENRVVQVNALNAQPPAANLQNSFVSAATPQAQFFEVPQNQQFLQ